MSTNTIIRAWKDPSYRSNLSEAARAIIPAHPAGTVEVPDPTLQANRSAIGFRVQSASRRGYISYAGRCSVYGDNLWTPSDSLEF